MAVMVFNVTVNSKTVVKLLKFSLEAGLSLMEVKWVVIFFRALEK